MKVGDLVKVYDPDEDQLDGTPYWTMGIILKVEKKSKIAHSNANRIFTIHAEGHEMIFDEPFWAISMVNSA